jgi:ATP-binding cassette subfamily B protein
MTPGGSEQARAGTLILRRVHLALRLAWTANPKALGGSAVITACLGIYPVAIAWLVKLVLDGLVGVAEVDVRSAMLGLVIVVAVGTSLTYAERYLSGQLRRSLQLLVQTRLFAAVNRFPGLEPFEQPSFHDRIQLAEQAGQAGPAEVVWSTASSLQAALTLSGFLGSLVMLDPRLALVALVAGVPGLFAELHVSRRRAGLAWKLSPARRRAMQYGTLQSDVQAVKEIRMFGLGDFLLRRMTGLICTANEEEQAMDAREVRIQAVLGGLGTVALAVGLFLVVTRAMAGGLTVGEVSVVLTALFAVQPTLANVASRIGIVHHALLLLDHYQSVIDAADEHPQGGGAVSGLRNGIELRNVWFRYDDSHPWVLRGVNLIIPKGMTLALVGVNGSGKTTLVKLLCRLYDPVKGCLTWDGTSLERLAHNRLRERISVVFQDFMTFDLSAAENIGIGDLENIDDRRRIRRAAQHAGIDEAIAALPSGYDTMLSRVFYLDGDQDGQTGVMLSGGQWQRVAIARALLRERTDLLVLDEPSSGLDAEAEAVLYRQIRELRGKCTTLIISHRLGLARDADRVAVMDHGRVIEFGTHDELIRRAGRYAELFNLQAEKYAPTERVEL